MAVREHGLFRLLETPAEDAAQGGCYVTHNTGPCVDTGVLIEYEGTLTLSLNTIKELAEVAGFSVDAEALENERTIAEQARLIETLEADKAELIEQLDAVGIAVARAAGIKAEA